MEKIKINKKQRESQEQQAFVQWCALHEHVYEPCKYVFAVPNGVYCGPRTGKRMKKEGVKSGVPDIWIPFAHGGKPGMIIEFKWGNNTTTDNQDKWIGMMTSQGWNVKVCYSSQEAITEMSEFYELRSNRCLGRVIAQTLSNRL